MVEPATVVATYHTVKACYAGGRFAYKVADKRVAAYAEAEGIGKSEAWARVRAEAKRQGDRGVEQGAGLMLKAGPVEAVLIPGGTVLYPAAQVWKALKKGSDG